MCSMTCQQMEKLYPLAKIGCRNGWCWTALAFWTESGLEHVGSKTPATPDAYTYNMIDKREDMLCRINCQSLPQGRPC